jgi:hypothetical protein
MYYFAAVKSSMSLKSSMLQVLSDVYSQLGVNNNIQYMWSSSGPSSVL